MAGIYQIKSPSGKSYVGATTRDFELRWKEHRNLLKSNTHPNKGLQRACNKYGFSSLEFIILEILPSDEKILATRESWWWKKISDTGFKLYNAEPSTICITGFIPSPETIAKRTNTLKNRPRKWLPRLCQSCSAEFQPARNSQVFCSRICSQKKLKENLHLIHQKTQLFSEETQKRHRDSLLGNANAKGNIGGIKTAHVRWHEARGLKNENCQFCLE